MKMTNLKIQRNLLLGLVSIVAIAGALTAVTCLSLATTNISLRHLYDVELSVLSVLKEVRANQSADRQDVMAMMLDKSPSQQSTRFHALKRRAGKSEADLELLTKSLRNFPLLFQEFQRFVALRRSFLETRDQRLVPLILAGRVEEAKNILLGIQTQRTEQMNAALDKLSNDFNAEMEQRLAEIRKSTTGMLRLLVGLSGIGLALSTVILYFVRKTITKLDQAESELKFRNAILTVQQETSLDDIMVVDPNGNVAFYNGRHADLWDVPSETLKTKPFLGVIQSLLHKLNDPESFLEKVNHLCDHKGEKSRDEILLNDGRVFDRYSAPLAGADGSFYGRIWYLRDITERKQAEKEIRDNWRLLQSVLDNSTAVIYVKDLGGRYLLINRRFEELFHVTRAWMVGRTDYDIFPRDRADAFRSFDRQVLATGTALESEELAPQDDGLHTYLSTKAPLLDQEGHLNGICGVSADITERKRAEQEHLSHLRFLESLELADRAIRQAESLDAMMTGVLDTALSIFESDRAWLLYPCDPDAQSWRVPMERTRFKYPGALVMGIDLPTTPEVREAFQVALNAADPVVYDPRSGRSLPPEVSKQFLVQSQIMVAVYPKRGKPWLFGMHQCTHARVWEEQDVRLFNEISRRIADGLSSLLFLRELQESREKLNSTLASMDDLVFVLDRDGRLADYFQPLDKPGPHGPPAALLGKTFGESLPPHSAEPLEKAIDAVRTSGAVHQVEYPVTTEGEERWYCAKASARKDATGGLAGITVVARDITQAKRIEEVLRKLSEELEQRVLDRTSQLEAANAELTLLARQLENAYGSLQVETEERLKMMEELREKDRMLIQQSHLATMGELMDCIAHNWRQPLNVLGLIVQETSMRYGSLPAEYVTKNAAKAMQMINDLSKTIDDFGYFFRASEEISSFKVKDVLIKAAALLEVGLREQRLRLDLVLEDEDAAIEGYQSEYFQVFANILRDAREACRERQVQEPRIVIRQFRENGKAVVTIADNAGEISEAIMARVFEPYLTTRGPGRGGGIGLYMAKIIIERNMNGSLSVRNKGDGAEFRIEVPSNLRL